MSDYSIAMLGERLERLERENLGLKRQARRWKRGGLLVAMTGAIVLMIGAAWQADDPEKWVTAEAFYLRDKDGKLRACLGLSEEGNASLNFYDKEGGSPLGMDVSQDGSPGLYFKDKEGRLCIGFTVTPDGESAMVFFGRDGKSRITTSVKPDDSATIRIYDQKHNVLSQLPTLKD